MNTIDENLVISYLLGELSPELCREFERRLADDPEVRGLVAAFSDIGLMVASCPPPSGLKARLMDSVQHQWFTPFIARFAELVDVGLSAAEGLLERVEGEWNAAFPGCWLIHFDGGPATVGADVGFVKVEAGARFPHHVHLGPERVLILQGGLLENDGTVYGPGDMFVSPLSAHSFVALPGEDLVYAVVVWGVDFFEAPEESGDREPSKSI